MRIFDKIMNNYSVKTRIPFPVFDVYYFRWNPFCRTSIHDHAPSGCVSILLKGGLNERLYDKDLNFIKKKLTIKHRIYHLLMIKKVIIL